MHKEEREIKDQRVVLSPIQSLKIPVYAETIGFNAEQERLVRSRGYPHYHWLQTISGEGEIFIEGRKITLVPQSGILISPQTPHQYNATTEESWETVYLTFGGGLVENILKYVEINTNTLYLWNVDSVLNYFIINTMKQKQKDEDAFGLAYSTNVYQFLLTLHNYGRLDKRLDVSESLNVLEPLIEWLTDNISNPDIGVSDFSEFLSVSPRKLNYLFQDAFKISPYSFLLNLRIRKAKEILHESKANKIKETAAMVGFRSVSHFVASFKRIVGLPPEQYKNLH